VVELVFESPYVSGLVSLAFLQCCGKWRGEKVVQEEECWRTRVVAWLSCLLVLNAEMMISLQWRVAGEA
jgi:hypothetical protein